MIHVSRRAIEWIKGDKLWPNHLFYKAQVGVASCKEIAITDRHCGVKDVRAMYVNMNNIAAYKYKVHLNNRPFVKPTCQSCKVILDAAWERCETKT